MSEKEKLSLLVVDDDETVLRSVATTLDQAGYRVMTSASAESALELLREQSFALVLCDMKMPQMDGISFLKAAKEQGSRSSIIIMSSHGSPELSLEVMRQGAYDYISKPLIADDLILTIKKAEEREKLRAENETLRTQLGKRYNFSNIVAKSEEMLKIFETVRKVGDYRTTVLIQGESGTGKELIARALHWNSARKSRPFVAINCGAIPENLLESELFGHKKGAFTDATKDKRGLFEEAQGGTILLDEIGELPLHLQVKLLRVLQENEIRPVGDSRVIPIDVRIVAATLRDLEQDVLQGRFRDDLFYRLNVISLRVPPLRERQEDIPLLIDFFMGKIRDRLKVSLRGVSQDALRVLLEHSWPGNIRELEHCIERAMILTEGEEIDIESLPDTVKGRAPKPEALLLGGRSLSIKVQGRLMEETLIRRALAQTGGNRTQAAKLLEISHRTLLYKLKEFGFESDESISEEAIGGE